MKEITATPQETAQPARWKWFLALGVLLLLLGLAGAGASTLLKLTSLVLFSPLLFASGIMQMVIAFFSERGKDVFLHLLAGGIEVTFGYLIMTYPVQGITDLAMLVAIFLTVSGLVRLARALVTHSPGRVWILMAAGGALILGICVWFRLPVTSLWFVGLCIALDFVCHGVSWSAIALTERSPLFSSASSEGRKSPVGAGA